MPQGGASGKPIEFRVLGPVEVVREGARRARGPPPARAAGAAPARARTGRVGRPVVEELWNGDPPALRRRRALVRVAAARPRSATTPPSPGGPAGYAMHAEPERVDCRPLRAADGEGHERSRAGRVARAAERLRGGARRSGAAPPFGELADEGALRAEAERLEELRLLALERRLEADLALGRAAELVDELETLVREHPYRERLWRHLMLALYRGRAAGGRARRVPRAPGRSSTRSSGSSRARS